MLHAYLFIYFDKNKFMISLTLFLVKLISAKMLKYSKKKIEFLPLAYVYKYFNKKYFRATGFGELYYKFVKLVRCF